MQTKPDKPRPDFPLYAHKSGQWAKKIRQKVHYFGPWSNPQAAERKYLDQKDDLKAGRTPNNGEGLTLKQLVNSFLNSKRRLVESGDIRQRTFEDYHDICLRVVKQFGKSTLVRSLRPIDFEKLRADFAKTHGPVTLCGDITCTRVLFKYADDTFGIRVNYGQGFKKPSRAKLRKHRQQRQPKMYQAIELRKIIKQAGIQLRAMIYLGLNCGFGNNDCAMLPMSAVDLKRGWVNFPRPKTGIDRRCPLWPETVKALKAALSQRPTPKDAEHDDRIFITRYGFTWESKSAKGDSPISKEFAKLVKSEKLKLYRKGLGFYTLRHILQTIGEKSLDKDAVRSIMGHAEAANDMSAIYNEEPVEDSRLQAVTDFVRNWLTTPIRQRQSA